MNYLISIIGPTAIGKTALSIKIAQHFNCEIISCDSRQFFKEMSIGTAVPSKDELTSVPHHFIQNISIHQDYSVGDFEKDAVAKLEQLFTNRNIAVMVGGSGLYADAIMYGLDDLPKGSPELREQLNQQFQNDGIESLQKQFEILDQLYFEKIRTENPQTLQNPQRLMRFIEVSKSSGKPYSSFIDQPKKARNFTNIVIGLEANREIMYDRINQRVDLMLQNGLEAEARRLFNYKSTNALQTVGYRELFDYFEGKIDYNFATEEIKKNTRRFAKRQLTWFKRNQEAKWFDYTTDFHKIISHISAQIK